MAGHTYHNLVLGLGNILLKDDGIGVWLVRELLKKGLPPGVEALEVGTGLFAVPGMLREKTRLLVVDAFRGAGRPGAVYRLASEDFFPCEPGGTTFTSLHDIRIPDLLVMPDITRRVCSWQIIGVEPQEISPGCGLTPCLQGKLSEISAILRQEAVGMNSW